MSIVLSAFLALIIMSGIINARSKKKIQSTTLVILSVFYIGSATLIYMSQYEWAHKTAQDVFSPEKQISQQHEGTGVIHFSMPKNMVWAEVSGLSESPSPFLIQVNDRYVSVDFEPRDDGTYISDPLFIDPSSAISFRINDRLPEWSLVAFVGITASSEESVNPFPLAYADNSIVDGITIIPRKEWGADEELRFADSQVWKDIFKKDQEAMPGVETEITKIIDLRFAKIRNVAEHIFKNNPSESVVNNFWNNVRLLAKNDRENLSKKSPKTLPYYESKIAALKSRVITQALDTLYLPSNRVSWAVRTENNRPLIWPIEYANTISHVIIHHTAEEGMKNLDDAATVRGIYYYHAIGRRWGDIGYNYIIGKTGKIYEGRSGGNGVVGAHTMWNNYGTIGISLVGNFEKNNPTNEQVQALNTLLLYLTKKNNLDIRSPSPTHRECLTNNACLLEHPSNPVIIGHGDTGYTACPGKNLKTSLNDIRSFVRTRSTTHIVVSWEANPAPTRSSASSLPQTIVEKNIRIRLSAPGDMITIRPYQTSQWTLESEGQKWSLSSPVSLQFKPTNYGVSLTVGNKTFVRPYFRISSSVLEISNWDHAPAWDTQRKYNDNVFRNTLEIRVENGKLIVINELPIEDYLRGLAEISNGDNPEKVKSILVSARGYATYYSDPAHRKFPDKPYDGSDNPDEFQKYLGYGYEQRSPQITALIEATKGEILAYSGTIIKPWYFNESDGKTLSYREYCLLKNNNNSAVCGDVPYLQSVLDPGGVGHTRKGHGVGLSGIGASYLAENLNYDYREILTYYFQGIEVKKVW